MKKFKDDYRISRQEKMILESWVLLREAKTLEIIDNLKKIAPENKMVEAQMQLILGVAYINCGQAHNAIHPLSSSIEWFIEFDLNNSLFTAQYNLFIAFTNCKNLKGMKQSFKDISHNIKDSYNRKILTILCEFILESFQFNKSKANNLFLQLEKLMPKMAESSIMTFLIGGFNFYIKCKNFERCESILNQLKFKRAFRSGANFTYMSSLLDYLVHESPIYVYERDFSDCSILYDQLMVICYLNSSQISVAEIHWEKLKLNYPEIYQNRFEYKGETTLFSLCLDKNRNKLEGINYQDVSHLNREEAIIHALKNSPDWVHKDDLYKMVFGGEAKDKFEMNRLQRFISKLRTSGYEIEFKKSSYKLNKLNSNLKIG